MEVNMEQVSIKLSNCYGIKSLEYVFDFKKRKNYLLYASNGMMKTSFTKTFKALSLGKKPADEVFQRKTTCEVKVDEAIINKEDIFVISSYEDEYISPNSAKLMVHKDLRARYDNAVTDLNISKNILLLAIDKIIQEENVALNYLSDWLECMPIDVLESLQKELELGILKEEKFFVDFSIIKYKDIFNSDVEKFISEPKNLEQIKEYEDRYNELLEKSPIFKRGVFSHNNADTVSENLSENGFFTAQHKIFLSGIDKEIKSAEDFIETLKEEKEKIFSDEKLKKKFDKINASLGKRTLVKFRSAIENNQEIIPQLSDYKAFKRKVWVNVLVQLQEEISKVIEEYSKCQETICEIKAQAKIERTQWDKVLEVFKARFTAPFSIEVPNKDDVLFSDKMPEFIFKYVDAETQEETEVQRKELEKVLSQGEKRALFLLNIINDLEAIKLSNKPCLIIADDIAESFDYKNKYAIIEYLQEMMENENFHFIVLTHNFDFYRTVANRAQKLIYPQMVQRKTNGVEIVQPNYVFKNPFYYMKKGMAQGIDKDIITSIPFVRNLIEYTEGEECDNFKLLTSLLHIKADTKNITLNRLEEIFNAELKTQPPLNFSKDRENLSVYKLIIDSAKAISQQSQRENIDLSGKIIISMAIRLLTEEYIIKCLTEDEDFEMPSIGTRQTGELVKLYKTKFPDRLQPISTLNKVLLMSSENIHINSFMFEPLIDMSIKSLINLYGEVCILIQ